MISARETQSKRVISIAPSPNLLQQPQTERNNLTRSSKEKEELIKRIPEDTFPVVEVKRLSAKKEYLRDSQVQALNTIDQHNEEERSPK